MTHPLRDFRKRQNLTLAELAARVGSSKFTLSRVETGKQEPSVDLLRSLIAETGITADAFLDFERAE